MAAIFKAYKIKIRHAKDGSANETPAKNEFRISFYPGGFDIVLIDLTKNSYMTIEKVIINYQSNEIVAGNNEQYNVKPSMLRILQQSIRFSLAKSTLLFN